MERDRADKSAPPPLRRATVGHPRGKEKAQPKRASSETLAKGAHLPAVAKPPSLGLSYSIRRQCRSDGVFFWHWEIRDERNWPVASGNVFGSPSNAVHDALSAVRDHQAARKRLPRSAGKAFSHDRGRSHEPQQPSGC